MADVEQVKFVLRMSPTLHRKIKRRAKANNTSMNKEINNMLNDALSSKSMDGMLKELIERLEKKKVI